MIDARRVLRERIYFSDGSFADLVIWQVPQPLRGSRHNYEYRLALVVGNECVLRYDNEPGKGDHKHVGHSEHRIEFTDLERLYADFALDAGRWVDWSSGRPGDE